MRVIVTRPAREAQDWVLALRQAGWLAEALPLIEIAPASDREAVRRAWSQLDDGLSPWRALMFVSANAVEGWFAACPGGASRVAATSMQAWATGPGTARALAAAGWPATRIVAPAQDAPQFDSEALWAKVSKQVVPGTRVLIVRGAHGQGWTDEAELSGPGHPASARVGVGAGRDWFARQVSEAGGQADFVATYQRCLPQWTDRQADLARVCAIEPAATVWLFSSSEAVRNLRDLLPGQDWRGARALVTHARIAQAARDAGFGDVAISRPALVDVQNALAAFAGQEPR